MAEAKDSPLFQENDSEDNDDDLFAPAPDVTVPVVDPLQADSGLTEESSVPGDSGGATVSQGFTDASDSEPLGVLSSGKPKTSIPRAQSVDAPSASSGVVCKTLADVQQSLKSGFTDKDGTADDDRKYSISISVINPKKVGDGVGAYMVYKVVTKTDIPDFRKSEMEVYRRFSEFLSLHEKLVVKHLHHGRIIPPAPEKSVIGMTKIKMSSEEAGSLEFVERRRAALERFINRVAAHPILQTDPSFVDFLEVEGDLPRSTSSTSALSGVSVFRLFSRMGDSIGKIAFKIDETDEWFEERALQLEILDSQLKKLHSSLELLVLHRRELSHGTGQFARAVATLGTCEEHTSLARALAQLAEVEEKLEAVQRAQSDADFYVVCELVHDYVAMVQAVKEALAERVKLYRTWKDNEMNLAKKREAKARFELAHKTDKVNEANREISEWECRVERDQEEFEAMSRQLKKELVRFDRQRCRDFQASVTVYLESLMNTQQQMVQHWELFLPEAKAVV